MSSAQERALKLAGIAVACAVLAACASPRRTPAPVEDRNAARQAAPVGNEPARVATAPAAPSDNAGKPGYFTVRPGDTVIRIALETGQNWRDIVRWNNLENPNVIEVGQVLRVTPPSAVDTAARSALPPASAASAPVAAASAASAPRGTSSAPASAQAAVPPEEEVAWAWPIATGAGVLAGFDEQKNKGLDIGGKPGDPILAAADGRVVYAGAGLRGYGNLIILKHNNTYLTAYAHNQALLVKEDQSVRKGQKIAEMGSSDTDRVKLHFEIRRQGKPVDPSRYLPAR